MDLDNLPICRVCMQTSLEYIDLETPLTLESDGLTFMDGFNVCTQLSASFSDNFPKNVCTPCGKELKTAYDFIKTAKYSDECFRRRSNDIDYTIKMESTADEAEFFASDNEDFEEIKTACDLIQPIEIQKIEEDAIPTNEEIGNEYNTVEFLDKIYQCETCGISLENEQSFEDHCNFECYQITDLKEQPGNPNNDTNAIDKGKITPHNCSMCGQNFNAKYLLKIHMKTVHGENGEKFVRCKQCGKLIDALGYRRHMVRVHFDKTFLCSKCPKIFLSIDSLRRHTESHEPNRVLNFKCETCGKAFNRQHSYKMHLQIHSSNRQKFTCEICGRKFAFSYGLTMHMKIHIGGEFECALCLKTFVRKTDLDIHMRFHTGNYPFHCDLCDKRFAIKSHLNDHRKKHLGITYKCETCDMVFKNNSTLRIHKYVHTKMPFPCKHCDKKFDSRYKIRRHIKNVHKIDISDEEFDQLFPRRNVIHRNITAVEQDEDLEKTVDENKKLIVNEN